jgi:hypothetical protein
VNSAQHGVGWCAPHMIKEGVTERKDAAYNCCEPQPHLAPIIPLIGKRDMVEMAVRSFVLYALQILQLWSCSWWQSPLAYCCCPTLCCCSTQSPVAVWCCRQLACHTQMRSGVCECMWHRRSMRVAAGQAGYIQGGRGLRPGGGGWGGGENLAARLEQTMSTRACCCLAAGTPGWSMMDW